MTDYAKEYGDWVREYHWTHWVHLTVDPKSHSRERRTMERVTPSGVIRKWAFRTIEPIERAQGRAGRCPRTVEGLERAFQDEFIRYCTKLAQGRVPYVYSVEMGGSGSNPHIHALIAGTEAIPSDRLIKAWRHGRAKVSVYDPRKNGATYLMKEAGRVEFRWGVSNTLSQTGDARLHLAGDFGKDHGVPAER